MTRPSFLLACLATVAYLGPGRGAADPPPRAAKSVAAKKAEDEYKDALAAAEKEYQVRVRLAQAALLKELEKAKEAATKAADLDDAVALRDRIKQLADDAPPPPRKGGPTGRDRLAAAVADAAWVGSPNWGRFVLKGDGGVQVEKLPGTTSRWGAVTDATVCVVDQDGNVSLLVFDRDRRAVKGYYAGKLGAASWDATRPKGR